MAERREGDYNSRRHVSDHLDAAIDKFSFTKTQLFDDSPSRSEFDQFGDFTGTRSQFASSVQQRYPSARSDSGLSLERGMAHDSAFNQSGFSVKSRGPALSTLSSLSAHEDSPRKAHSESNFVVRGHHAHGGHRFTPMSARKVTALGPHASETEASPSERLRGTAQTPHARFPASTRKVSPKTFKSTAALFEDLGLTDSPQAKQPQTGQSFMLPRDMPDLSTLLSSTRKPEHKTLESIPVSEDNRKLFAALQAMQDKVASLEQQLHDANAGLKAAHQQQKTHAASLAAERERANFAEAELKQALQDNKPVKQSEDLNRSLEQQNARLVQQLQEARTQLEQLQARLQEASDESKAIEEERDEAIARLAKALERIDILEGRKPQKQVKQQPVKEARPSPADRINERLQQAKQARQAEDYTDEAIEVSKSVLDEEEVRELTQEIEQSRKQHELRKKQKQQQQKMERKRQKSKPVVVETVLETESDVSEADLSQDETDYLDAEEPVRILRRTRPVKQRSTSKSGTPRAKTDDMALQAQVEQVIRELSKHDAAHCTICTKKRHEQQQQQQQQQKPSSTSHDEHDATIRPSQPPMEALSSVLSALQDEFRHLKLEHASLASAYKDLAPELGKRKRKRKQLADGLRGCIEKLEAKADQIYAVFDVVEAAGQGDLLLDATTNAGPVSGAATGYPAGPGYQASRPPWLTT
jgi:hypothetical protein